MGRSKARKTPSRPPSRKSPKKPVVVVKKRRRAPPTGPTCIDLFAGAGGLAEGFRQAGWGVVAANDADKAAAATFQANFPEATFFTGPVSQLDPAALLAEAGVAAGELDCLIGGPPCQSFSYNNHERSAKDTRAKLFQRYLRIVAALKPKTLVMENVPGMLTIGDGSIVIAIKRRLAKLGYKMAIRILYAEDFGVPQARRRVFVVASCVGDPAELFPSGSHGPSAKPSAEATPYVHRWTPPEGVTLPAAVTVGEAIGDLPVVRNGGGEAKRTYGKKPSTEYQREARRRSRLLHNHVCHHLADTTFKRVVEVPEGGNWRDIPRRLLPAGMKRALKKDHTKRYGRLDRGALASTILTKCDPHWGAYVHPTQSRTITVREAARLQGFPDRFRFCGDHLSKQYEQVGNAVPPPLARAIAKNVKEHLDRAAKLAMEPAAGGTVVPLKVPLQTRLVITPALAAKRTRRPARRRPKRT